MGVVEAASVRASGRDLPLLLGGAAVSMAGSSVSLLAVAVHLRPAGAGWVAAAFAAEVVPMIVLSVVAGNLVDRVRNRELLLGSLLLQGCAVLLAAVVGLRPGLEVILLGALAVMGGAGAIAGPAVAALLPRISGEERATRAYGWYSALTQMGFLGGFAVAGVLVQATSVRVALVLDAGSYAVMAVAVAFVRTQRRPRGGSVRAGGPRLVGFVLLSRDRLLLTGVAGLGVAIFASVVVNVAEVFYVLGDIGAGPAAYGLVTACWPAAGVLGGWAAGRLVGDGALVTALAGASVLMGGALLLAGAVVSLACLIAAWLLGGTANAVQRVSINALVRSRTADAQRGRVFAALGGIFQAANVLGLVAGAAIVGLLGPRASLLYAGALTAAAGTAAWLAARPALKTTTNQNKLATATTSDNNDPC